MANYCWIIYNGHLKGPKFRDFAEWLQKAAEKQNVHAEIVPNNHLLSSYSSDGLGLHSMKKENLPDFVLFGDKDIHLARQLEALDVPVYNSASAIELCDDKIRTYQALSADRLPIPKTIAAPKIFPGAAEIDQQTFLNAGKSLHFPLILKEAYGSFGEQVYLLDTPKEMLDKIKEIQDRPFVLQEFISSSRGKDVRLNVVGNKVVASMLRTSLSDFRANVSAGGKMEPYQPSKEEQYLAIRAAKAAGADFAGVDLLFGPDGPVVCEVNSNAHIRNIYDCTKINVAEHIIEYVLHTQK
ncbi:ATP-grasp domain-containing protein [Sediminibacillus massiliensis]|uniref:ATP-grasp domain-containing protein n=1 Tax=Sediminibacillus massiliensis TaxID=1926277 RepID=UPI00098852BA|nr:RimK family alpha-L-glutamate ligase [Sediminibacillus massiliensis]